jgi:hypothetical protein
MRVSSYGLVIVAVSAQVWPGSGMVPAFPGEESRSWCGDDVEVLVDVLD